MIYALMGLIGFGLSDFAIVYLTKSAGFIKGMFWNTVFMTLYLIILIPVFGGMENLLNLQAIHLLIGTLAGILSTLGGYSFFKGTQKGNLSVLSPIASTYSVIIILFSIIFLSEKLYIIQTLAIVLVILGTILVSTNFQKFKNLKLTITDKSVPYALSSMLFWGLSFILIGNITIKIGWLETIVLNTISGLALQVIIILYTKSKIKVTKKAFKIAAMVGFFNTLGYLGYSLGVNSIYTSIVAPIVAASPFVTVILALIFLKEKLALEQKLGITILIAGLIILAL